MHVRPLFPFGFGMSYVGSRAGADVAQVYVGSPGAKAKRPLMELKHFSKVRLKPGGKQHVVLHLDRRAFSYYDTETKKWQLDPGSFDIFVGDSSEDAALKHSLQM